MGERLGGSCFAGSLVRGWQRRTEQFAIVEKVVEFTVVFDFGGRGSVHDVPWAEVRSSGQSDGTEHFAETLDGLAMEIGDAHAFVGWVEAGH